MTPSCLLV